jgi:hypothetical protein
MAPVPAFDSRGFLPPLQGADATTSNRSPYETTMVELVTALATTPRRRDLLKGLLGYRSMLDSTPPGYSSSTAHFLRMSS